MTQLLKNILLFLFLFIHLDSLPAQTAFKNVEIESLFKNPKQIQWKKYYKGRVNDMNDVSLILAYDGKYCQGFITYLRSNTRFKLIGKIKKGELNLKEVDEEESITGYLDGHIKTDRSAIRVHWYNREKTRAGFLDLKETTKEVVLPSFCGENKWIRKYEGGARAMRSQFILQKDSDAQLTGNFWYLNKSWNYQLKGAMTTKNKFKVFVTNDLNQSKGEIEGEINPYNLKITGIWEDERGEKTRMSYQLDKSFSVGCIEYMDYMTSYDATYPKTKNAHFNTFVEQHVNTWKEDCLSYAQSLKKTNPIPSEYERNIAAASGWYQLDYITDTIASGYLFFSNSWKEEELYIPFNFDVIQKRNIALEEFFKKNTDYHAILKELAMNKIQYKAIYGDEVFKKWIKNTDFGYFTIRHQGIAYGTSFHPIYGRQVVTIPYSELKSYLNPYSKIAYLYNPIIFLKKR